VFVTGSPGDSAAGLALEQNRLHVSDRMAAQILRDRFLFPTPRCDVGVALRGLASACIDVSDGLGGDLEKLCAASGCGAEIDAATLPVSDALINAVGREVAREYALTGGEDYELLFTVPLSRLGAMTHAIALGLGPVTRIGSLVSGNGVRVFARGGVMQFSGAGFDHFAR
jgi:thiamine-monophosphate kinase